MSVLVLWFAVPTTQGRIEEEWGRGRVEEWENGGGGEGGKGRQWGQGTVFSNAQCPMPNSQCPMPNAQFPKDTNIFNEFSYWVRLFGIS
jgi:hypothetical protein